MTSDLVQRPGLVIFDNDGVLVDSETLSNTVMAGWLDELGVPTTPEGSMGRFMGRSLGAVREIVETEDAVDLPADFEAVYNRRLAAVFATSLRAVPGMIEVVRRVADAGVAYCVASSGGHEKIALTHRLTGYDELFDGRRFSADDVDHGKPEPDLFLHAAAAMGVGPSRCVVVEDSAAGVTAAERAGAPCVGFAARSDPALVSHASLGVVHDAAELADLLGI